MWYVGGMRDVWYVGGIRMMCGMWESEVTYGMWGGVRLMCGM